MRFLQYFLFGSFLLVTITSTTFAESSSIGEEFNVSGVEIEGNNRVDTAAIRQQLKKTTGKISKEVISEDIKTLYKTGFFDQVNASMRGATLVYAVVEKPLVRKVFIKGNAEVDESDLSDVLKFGPKRFLDKTKLDSLKRDAISFYQSKGFYDVDLTHSVVPVGENQVDVTFTVSEGKRYRVRQIVFRGLKNIDEDDLRDAMQTKQYKWWSSWLFGTGRLNPDMLENDRLLVRQYFLDHGYIDGGISDPIVEKKDDGIHVTFDISEGREYKIGAITASGDLVDGSDSKTLEGAKLISGSTFSAAGLRDDAFTISGKFTDVGYAFANIVPNTNVNREAGTVDVNYTVNKGKLVTVDRINIHGNDKTYDNVIRREMTIDEQQKFSSSKIKRSQELLQRLGYFEEVNITSEPKPGQDDKVDLQVNVREASTGSFSAGVGYSTADGAIFNARISENNIMGTGRRADLNLDVGTQRNNATLSFSDRRLNDSKVSGGVEAYYTDREFDDYNRVLKGGAVSLGYPLDDMFGEWAEDMSANLRYDLFLIDINNIDDTAPSLIKNSAGSSTASAITPSLQRSTINNPLNPRSGSQQVISYEYGGLGGDEEYTLLEGRNQWYQPLFDSFMGEFVFSLRTRVSYGESQNDDPFPLFKRFFPGGINSVRGFKNRRLGPKENGQAYGGASQFINNTEILFPLINSAGLKGLFFYDIGNAFDDNKSIDFSDLRESWGTGIRWTSPLGPIRLEFGFPIDREEGEKSMVTMFSFGTPM